MSKSFRVVDTETRREFKDKRIQALESDNYIENETQNVDDDAYDVDSGVRNI